MGRFSLKDPRRIGVAAIVLFLVPVTLIMHPFWADRNLAQHQSDLINFTKNIGLLGSSLMFLGVPRPLKPEKKAGK